ncbi:class IIb bacteriocin, lactobin A/cerein 7B family [Oceanivirga salmonicida]|nr:class IIb bacteriocin, lactobin A/cerein 7B family [Oceanivirga salmonicida]
MKNAVELNENELMKIDGGIVITGSMIIGSGIAIAAAVGLYYYYKG